MNASCQVEIVNQKGLHARASAAFSRLANEYQAKVTVRHEEVSADAGSIMDLLFLAASKGRVIEISAEGEDAEAAVNALRELVENRFGEEC